MKTTQIIEELRNKLTIETGRHLYGILGTYPSLAQFAKKLRQVKIPGQKNFPASTNVNKGILEAIPDDEFRTLAENEAKRPEPTTTHVHRAFEKFLRARLKESGLIILERLELLFAYNLELSLLRTMAADDYRIILLLPGIIRGNAVVLFPELEDTQFKLPSNLIAENHMWEIRE